MPVLEQLDDVVEHLRERCKVARVVVERVFGDLRVCLEDLLQDLRCFLTFLKRPSHW
jgi:hypothetical protein